MVLSSSFLRFEHIGEMSIVFAEEGDIFAEFVWIIRNRHTCRFHGSQFFGEYDARILLFQFDRVLLNVAEFAH